MGSEEVGREGCCQESLVCSETQREQKGAVLHPCPPPPLPMLLQIKGKEVCDLTTEVSNLASAGIFCMARDV